MYEVKGTIPYLDPILKKSYMINPDPRVLVQIDLFKADIYSLAITLYYIMTGLEINELNLINESEEIFLSCY